MSQTALRVYMSETKKNNSPHPLTHNDLASEHSTSVTTPAGDGASSKSITFDRNNTLSTQEPERADDYNSGDIQSKMSSSITRGRAWHNDAKLQSSPEAIENQSGLTRNQTADSHRKSKTEFNSIPDEVVPVVELDMARYPGTDSRAHRKSSTEFDAGLVNQPHVHSQAIALPPVVPKTRSAPEKRQDNGGRKADSQLWQKSGAQESSQQLWR
ncbi:uncharacterized protein LY79DRAFT_649192 [Colletotrichum navitas]|uniref:Uncharacterized protein n=1 Tax=Colletotrichum navitas TaxID=681940 RepID=A0AAD8V5M9_9PEZI|nr:uncharacterized protein LY79DRAFT_649192 [Colletotrichum navitas]KAK1593899.1 hypothetical protein LY79DRAFT_649192 [Colletotrichum navitas]